ncbi:MAG: histidine kinase [Ardenticatenaceae bacterium]|nr:histidine kinase [Ardenticatenaceae bacterium]
MADDRSPLTASSFPRVMRVPLLTKILVANSLIVTLGAIVGTVVTVWHVQTFPETIHYDLIILFAALGVVISYLVNRWVLKLALKPLDEIQNGVEAVAAGDLNWRIDHPTITDDRFDRLIETFNHMLDELQTNETRLHQLSHQILRAQEEERRRLARELHDEAAQALTSLLVQLRLLERAYKPEEAQQRVKQLRELTAQALEEVRRVAVDLRPTILDDLGLVPALEWRVDEIAKVVRATFVSEGLTGRLPRDMELVFYRIAQEALTNAVRHAQAAQIDVSLIRQGDIVSLTIVDNGRGFDPSLANGTAGRRGLGLVGMRERISMLDGQLEIVAEPDRGCRLTARARVKPPHLQDEMLLEEVEVS